MNTKDREELRFNRKFVKESNDVVSMTAGALGTDA
jgi:hypothetical protein